MMQARSVLSLVALASILNVGSAVAAPIYQVTDLGGLGVGTTRAAALNERGQVVGTAHTLEFNGTLEVPRAFLWSSGQITDVGADAPNYTSMGTAIDSQSRVYGFAGPYGFRAIQNFVWESGTATSLPVSGPVYGAVNDVGQIAVRGFFGSVDNSLFNVSSGTFEDLGFFGTVGALNNQGAIVGSTGLEEEIYLYRNGQRQDQGIFGAATGINEAGQFVGAQRSGTGPYRAFVSSNGTVTDLSALAGNQESVARAINDSGDVVGEVGVGVDPTRPMDGSGRAFLFQDGQAFDLNSLISATLGIELRSAAGINNRGQIIANSADRAYLLTPISAPSNSPVPEPSAWMLAGSGLTGLLVVRWRAR